MHTEQFRCRAITREPHEIDAIDVMALRIGNGTVEHRAPRADNEARASWGLAALRAYVHRTRAYGDPPETVLSGLVADLRHLCDVLGLEFEDILYSSHNHYDHEVRGE